MKAEKIFAAELFMGEKLGEKIAYINRRKCYVTMVKQPWGLRIQVYEKVKLNTEQNTHLQTES